MKRQRRNPDIPTYQRAMARYVARLAEQQPGSKEYRRTQDDMASLVLRVEQDPHIPAAEAASFRRAALSAAQFQPPGGRSSTSGGSSPASGSNYGYGQQQQQQRQSHDPWAAEKESLRANYHRIFHSPPDSEQWHFAADRISKVWKTIEAVFPRGIPAATKRFFRTPILNATFDSSLIRQWRENWERQYGGKVTYTGHWTGNGTGTRKARAAEGREDLRSSIERRTIAQLLALYMDLLRVAPTSLAFFRLAADLQQWWVMFQRTHTPAQADIVLGQIWGGPALAGYRKRWLEQYPGNLDYLGKYTPAAPKQEPRRQQQQERQYREGEQTRMFNPVTRARDGGYYAVLPPRYALRGSVWWIGPYKTENQALGIAGMVQGGSALVDGADAGFYVRVGGLRLTGTPRLGPFRRPVEAGAVLGRLLPAGALPPEKTWPAPAPRSGRPAAAPPPPVTATSRQAAAPKLTLTAAGKEAVEALASMGQGKTEAKEYVLQAQERLGPAADASALLRAVFAHSKSNPLNAGAVYELAVRTAQNPTLPRILTMTDRIPPSRGHIMGEWAGPLVETGKGGAMKSCTVCGGTVWVYFDSNNFGHDTIDYHAGGPNLRDPCPGFRPGDDPHNMSLEPYNALKNKQMRLFYNPRRKAESAACVDCGAPLTVPARVAVVTCGGCGAKMAVGR